MKGGEARSHGERGGGTGGWNGMGGGVQSGGREVTVLQLEYTTDEPPSGTTVKWTLVLFTEEIKLHTKKY